MDEKTILEQEKREARRKRRKKNEILSYVTIFLFIALLSAAGVVVGMKFAEKKQVTQTQEELVAQIEEQIEESEPEIVLTEPEEEPEIILPSEDEIADSVVTPIIEAMTLEEKVAGLFIVAPEAITNVDAAQMAGDGTKSAIEKYPVGGFIYFDKNIVNKDQFTEMLQKTQEYCKYPMFLAVDEEGGEVSRIANSSIDVPKQESEANIGATGDANNAYASGTAIAGYLKELGLNLDLAPVADVSFSEDSYIAKRSFGSDPDAVASFVANEVSGLQDNGVSACLKHFPGLGSTTEDTHETMVTSDRPSEDFRQKEFKVFSAGIEAGSDFVMVSHLSLPTITGDNTPCCLTSSIVTDILRNELGYNGIVITDAMNMGAISEYYAADEAAIMALRAGCDMILMPEDFELAYNGILNAISEGKIAQERVDDALKRIYKVKMKEEVAAAIASGMSQPE